MVEQQRIQSPMRHRVTGGAGFSLQQTHELTIVWCREAVAA